jgi:hypothetical protein
MPPMKLKLRPLASGALTEVSLSGAVSTTMSLQSRRKLVRGLARAGVLEVALCVAADGLHDWCDEWIRALEGQVSVRFEPFDVPSAGGHRDA